MNAILPSRGANRYTELTEFANTLIRIDEKTGFKVSSRGWAYQLEGLGMITKGEFNRVQNLINECRKNGLLPIDFVAEENARKFAGIYKPDTESMNDYVRSWIEATLCAGNSYQPDYWDNELYFIQMLVEKTDLISLFKPICEEYHIGIATSKGWSSILQRADIAKRFKAMEETGHISVLLYAGDHDPVGLGISDTLRKNFRDIENGTRWNPEDLIIDRFGLNYDFITKHGLTWIDNLETGSGKPADETIPMVKRYVEKFGRRKVEANAIVVNPTAGRALCKSAIEKYLGDDVLNRWAKIKQHVLDDFESVQQGTGILEPLEQALKLLNGGIECH